MGLQHYTQDMSKIPQKYHKKLLFYTKYTHPTLICRGTDGRTDRRTDAQKIFTQYSGISSCSVGSTYTCMAHSLPGLTNNLLSVAVLCNAGCEVFFNATGCKVTFDGEIILRGWAWPQTLPLVHLYHWWWLDDWLEDWWQCHHPSNYCGHAQSLQLGQYTTTDTFVSCLFIFACCIYIN